MYRNFIVVLFLSFSEEQSESRILKFPTNCLVRALMCGVNGYISDLGDAWRTVGNQPGYSYDDFWSQVWPKFWDQISAHGMCETTRHARVLSVITLDYLIGVYRYFFSS